MSNKYYVYVYLDPRKPGTYQYGDYMFDYEPFYVGKGTSKRMYQHLFECHLKENTPKNNKIKKILSNDYNIKKYIIKVAKKLTNDESIDLEKKLIKIIGRYDLNEGPLNNLTDGGDGGMEGFKYSEESKRKMSKSKKGKHSPRKGKKHTEETKRKMSKSKKGKPSPNKGKPLTEETKKKLSEVNKGKKHSEETKKKISEKCKGGKGFWKGKKLSDNHCKNISESLKGENNGFYGKKHSEETKKKISEKCKNPSESIREKMRNAAKNKIYIKTCEKCNEKFEAKGSRKKYCNKCE